MRIFTDGAMDLFHPGHIRLLRRIKEAYPGCHLTVFVDSDEIVQELKGHQPAMRQDERMEMVAACRYVDEVRPTPDEGFSTEVVAQFDLLVRGDDPYNYAGGPYARWYAAPLAQGKIVTLARTPEVSSSDIIQRIRAGHGG